MATRTLLEENRQIQRAVRLIMLGARPQVLEAETKLPYERLLKLYKEVCGKSPPKGQLPFSTDWFLTWQPNVHASLFLNVYEYLQKASAFEQIDAVIKAFELYLAELASAGVELIDKDPRTGAGGHLIAFVHPKATGGVLLELCQPCPAHSEEPSRH